MDKQPVSAAEKARAFFLQGYNCSQSVAAAFADVMGLTEEQAARMASALGGGLCRMRESCGAVTGAMLVLGVLQGYGRPDDAAKAALYARGQRVLRAFRDLHGSLRCREILHLPPDQESGPVPTPRTAAFYQSRPCAQVIYDAARLLEEELNRA